ncbi:MAG: response regulator transcription factor [Syntrophomonadaceae bacterium]|nr:response regulator transcription factor [Syntrophomonadaceae bacterium]MDD3270608.1 response regulator transcription factor [Syntrophomonadaceae bacterium]MDD3897852.1 response regulator transcription factor [Syntrophomonadaceae bacterium]MDD4561788.1 response regulator transcription factor [Syntrophomonadaceae bacterium]
MKLMLVDDHPLFLEGLQYLLETYGIEVVGVAQDGREALAQARVLKPDIILMDIKMPGCSGIDALKLIKAEMPDIKIIMLSTSDEDDDLFDAVKYGASGYLLKNTNAKDLVDMLSDLEKGEVPLSPGLAARLFSEYRRSTSHESRPSQHMVEDAKEGKLTDRQLEVLELVAQGSTYKEVGGALGLTERTVKYHMGRIIELLHLENRTQVVAYAARIGLVENTPNSE